jgi:hypothetical protein
MVLNLSKGECRRWSELTFGRTPGYLVNGLGNRSLLENKVWKELWHLNIFSGDLH